MCSTLYLVIVNLSDDTYMYIENFESDYFGALRFGIYHYGIENESEISPLVLLVFHQMIAPYFLVIITSNADLSPFF